MSSLQMCVDNLPLESLCASSVVADASEIIEKDISPRIYRILSDLLPAEVDGPSVTLGKEGERDVFVAKLTKCWSDCAAVVVVEHHKLVRARTRRARWTPDAC